MAFPDFQDHQDQKVTREKKENAANQESEKRDFKDHQESGFLEQTENAVIRYSRLSGPVGPPGYCDNRCTNEEVDYTELANHLAAAIITVVQKSGPSAPSPYEIPPPVLNDSSFDYSEQE